MKKRILALIISFVFLFVMAVPVQAAAEDVPFSNMVLDDAGLLFQSEAEELDNRAWAITHTYGCAVYIVTLESLEGMEAWEITEAIQEMYGMGYGSDQSCVILMLSLEEREYNIMARGYGNIAFTDYGKQKLANTFLDEFENDDWYGGFTEYLDGCDQYLQAARNGNPVDKGRSPILGILLGTVAPMLIAFIVCSKFKAQMRTANLQRAARGYVDEQGLVLVGHSDIFQHTTRTEKYIEPKKSSTSVNKNGNSHSSGKF